MHRAMSTVLCEGVGTCPFTSRCINRAHKQYSLYSQGGQSPLEALRATSLEARLQSSGQARLGNRRRPAVSHSPAGGGLGWRGRVGVNLLVREPKQAGMNKLTL